LHLIGYIAHITKFQKDPATNPAEKEAKGNLSKKEAKGAVPHNPIYYCCWWSHARNSQKAMHVRMVVVPILHPYAVAKAPNKTRGTRDGRCNSRISSPSNHKRHRKYRVRPWYQGIIVGAPRAEKV
jgi:hypothetical protein